MKHLFGLLFSIMILLYMSIAVSAVETASFYLDALDMEISVPEGYYTLTRELSDGDSALNALGLNKEDVLATFESFNIYLDAMDPAGNVEVVVTMTDSPLEDFTQLSDTTILTLLDSFVDLYQDNGITYDKSEIYQHSQAKFAKIYFVQTNSYPETYGLQYYTVYGEKAINITLYSYTGTITEMQETALKKIVDSVHFGTDPAPMEIPEETSAFVYTDDDSGVTFTVPANWKEVPMSEDRDFLDAKFVFNQDEAICIFYGSTDLWSQVGTGEQEGYTRADIDNYFFTREDIAESMGVPADEVSTATYGGKEYYRAEITSADTSLGIAVSVKLTYLMRLENGYIYQFEFGAPASHELFPVFEELMDSVEYPQDVVTPGNSVVTDVPSSDEMDLTEENRSSSAGFGKWNLNAILLNLLLTIVLHPLPLWVYRYAIKKEPIEPKRAKRIVVMDAVVVFVVIVCISTVTGGTASSAAVVLWGVICYKSLTSGYTERRKSFPANPYYRDFSTPKNDLIETEASVTEPENLQELSDPDKSSNPMPDGITAEYCDETEGHLACADDQEDGSNAPASDDVYFCRKCGEPVLEDSLFCSRCGAKIR